MLKMPLPKTCKLWQRTGQESQIPRELGGGKALKISAYGPAGQQRLLELVALLKSTGGFVDSQAIQKQLVGEKRTKKGAVPQNVLFLLQAESMAIRHVRFTF